MFWQVGSSATLGTGSVFRGNILALTSISVSNGVVIHGRHPGPQRRGDADQRRLHHADVRQLDGRRRHWTPVTTPGYRDRDRRPGTRDRNGYGHRYGHRHRTSTQPRSSRESPARRAPAERRCGRGNGFPWLAVLFVGLVRRRRHHRRDPDRRAQLAGPAPAEHLRARSSRSLRPLASAGSRVAILLIATGLLAGSVTLQTDTSAPATSRAHRWTGPGPRWTPPIPAGTHRSAPRACAAAGRGARSSCGSRRSTHDPGARRRHDRRTT